MHQKLKPKKLKRRKTKKRSNTQVGFGPSFTINVDAMPITIISKKKPNIIMKFIYKSMGMKWKAE